MDANRTAPTLLLALVTLACAGGPGETPRVAEWSLSAEPTLVIGEDGTVEGELVRVVTALALPGDEVAVVDAGHSEIRVFDGAGRYLRTIGRKGEGPGEFSTQIEWAQIFGDTLLIYDASQRRITYLGADGTVHATLLPRPEGESGFATPLTRDAAGNWVVRNSFAMASLIGQNAGIPSGMWRDTIGIGLLPADGAGAVRYLLRSPGRPIIGVPEHRVAMPGRFSVQFNVTQLGGRLAIVDPDAATIRWFTPDGQEQALAPLGVPRRPLSRAMLDSLRATAMERSTSPRGRDIVEAQHSAEAAPSHLPVFRAVLPDGDDLLWLEEWQYGAPDSARYLVVNGTGEWLATVKMPPGFSIVTVGPDWVLGVHRDADGVPRVMRYGLVRR